jgi:hypothetical protein
MQLRDVLSEKVKAWEAFRSAGGDIGYFQDVGSSRKIRFQASQALERINQTFETLKVLEQKLESLDQRCQKLAGFVSHSS